jgi:hypothetical protein
MGLDTPCFQPPSNCHLIIRGLEGAYIGALHGIAPDPELFGEMSSDRFKGLIESLALLFSSRLPNETHILAALMLDTETAERYCFLRHKAAAQLRCFSWTWRFLVMFSIATIIFGPADSNPRPASNAERTRTFCNLLRSLPPKDHAFVVTASESWPEALAEPFGLR